MSREWKGGAKGGVKANDSGAEVLPESPSATHSASPRLTHSLFPLWPRVCYDLTCSSYEIIPPVCSTIHPAMPSPRPADCGSGLPYVLQAKNIY